MGSTSVITGVTLWIADNRSHAIVARTNTVKEVIRLD